MCRAEYDRGLTMSEDEPLELAGERDFISGIYNYCDRWCEKCPFTSRCRVYATEAADMDLDDPEVHDINNEKFWRKLESIFREAHEKMDSSLRQNFSLLISWTSGSSRSM